MGGKLNTKFKYGDKVKLIGKEVYGELIDIIPIGYFNNRAIYKYVMFTPKGKMIVNEEEIEWI